jgi:hypothetical protein
MPRRSLPIAMPGDAPTTAPKQKRKRPAVRKNASKPARKRTEAKIKRSQTKPSQQVSIPPLVQLPAPRRVPLLTHAGESQQISSGAATIDLPHPIDEPSAPQLVDAVHRDDPALSGARATAAPEAFTRSSQDPVAARVRRVYSVDPRVAVKVGLTGAIIGAVLLLARLSPVKPDDAIVQHDLTPANTMLVQDTGERSDAVVRTAMQSPRPAHHPNFARTIRAKRSQHAVAHVRIIDGPARMKQGCGEQTWPYIADYCLTIAKDDVSPAPAGPVAAKPLAAPAPRATADGVDASPAQAVHVGDAAGSHSSGNGVVERGNYQTAALLDDAPAATKNEKSEPARRAADEPRHYEPRHYEPRRHYAHLQQASTEDERPVRARHVSERRHYEERRHYAYARLRQRPERWFAGGPRYAVQSYATEPSSYYAPWY